MVYNCKQKIRVTRNEFERYRLLFKVNMGEIDENGELTREMEKLANAIDYRVDTTPVSFAWFFENNTAITLDIRCGQSCAYDDCLLWKTYEENREPFGDTEVLFDEDIYVFDCDYDIRQTMEFNYQGDTYICEFEIEEDENVTQS